MMYKSIYYINFIDQTFMHDTWVLSMTCNLYTGDDIYKEASIRESTPDTENHSRYQTPDTENHSRYQTLMTTQDIRS